MSWLRLWALGAVKPVGHLQLFNCINEPVFGLGSESGETHISGTNRTHCSTTTTRGSQVAKGSMQSGQKHQTLHGCSLGHVSQY